jgi:hypothetical protein
LSGSNPHMRGTTSALRMLFGKGLGSDWESEPVGRQWTRLPHLRRVRARQRAAVFGASSEVSGRHLDGCDAAKLPHSLRGNDQDPRAHRPDFAGAGRAGLGSSCHRECRRDRSVSFRECPPPASGCSQRVSPIQSAHGVLRWGDRLNASYLLDVVDPTLRGIAARVEL